MPERVLIRNCDYATKLGADWVLLDAEAGTYVTLKGTAAELWELLEHPTTRQDLARMLAERYEVSEQQCAQDIEPALTRLLRTGLVVPAERVLSP